MTDVYTAIPIRGITTPAYANQYGYHSKSPRVVPASTARSSTKLADPSEVREGASINLQVGLTSTGYIKRSGYISASIKIQLFTKNRGQKFDYNGFTHKRWTDATISNAQSTRPEKWNWRVTQSAFMSQAHPGCAPNDGQRRVAGVDSAGDLDAPH
jgi:hypothetical protein